MGLPDYYQSKKLALSFELFPPKTEEGEAMLLRNVEKLMTFSPDFITCTYGAGGSTRDKTLDIVQQVKVRFDVPVASHLTCVGATVPQLQDYLSEAHDRGVDYIVALRGDPPRGQTDFKPEPGGLEHANELVDLVRSQFPQFGIAVAGYPEKHREAPSLEVDLENLQRKVSSGADVVITQLFYQNDNFFAFTDKCRELGIQAPIVPGILPVTNLTQVQRIASLCGAQLPESFIQRLGEKDDDKWQHQVGVEFAVQQVRELIQRGVPGIHFYVLNKSKATSEILREALDS